MNRQKNWEEEKRKQIEEILHYTPDGIGGYLVDIAGQNPSEEIPKILSLIQSSRQSYREEVEKVIDLVIPMAQKFIDKVETGRARSVETYADMKEAVRLLQTLKDKLSEV